MAPPAPIYAGTRLFLGRKDLVVSFYTLKCQFECAYCALPLRSAEEPLSSAALQAQIDSVFQRHAVALPEFGQLSFGNEGSVLDKHRFPPQTLHYLLDQARALSGLEVLSVETRPEYITPARLNDIRARTQAPRIDVTVGFETQDDYLRMVVLRKKLSRRVIESRLAILGELGVRFTSYIMIKPAPGMTEEQGVQEAVATIEYLLEQCRRRGVEFIAYLTPTYIAKGSYLARTASPGDYTPPTIQSIARVVLAACRLGVPVYTGLWSEQLIEEGGDFRGRDGYDPALRQAIVEFNKTNDPACLTPLLDTLEG
jgi:archaeosine synthase beta-subunit